VARVLIVDDERGVREFLSQLLLEDGYEVAEADDGAAALRLLERGPFDLILLDMMMPGMDGWELARRIDERKIETPILVVTAMRNAAEVAEELGAVGYITKPFDIGALSRAVRRALPDHTGPAGMLPMSFLFRAPQVRFA
jgi:CheY-like chemotaxis protein